MKQRASIALIVLFGLLGLSASMGARAGTGDVVISQVYGGGGNSGATYDTDFVELFNSGSSAVDISGWSVQYASSSGSGWGNETTIIGSGATLQPGQYYLVAGASGTNGTALPTPDASGGSNLSGTHGKLALVSDSVALIGDCPTGGSIVDFVGYGDDPNCFEGSGPTGNIPSGNTSAALRDDAGCTDSDDNAADFSVATPAPRNTTSATNVCSGGSSITLSVAAVELAEGNAAISTFAFTVTLSQPAPVGGVSFDVASADGTATVADSDYAAVVLAAQTIAEGSTTYNFNVDVNGDLLVEDDEPFDVLISNISGTDVGTTSAQATGTILNDDALAAEIFEIQGSGDSSPLLGQLVRVSNNIVTAVGTEGFVVQTPDADADADPLTSNGIYVYTGSVPTVHVRDLVSFDATVDEFFGLTELTNPSQPLVISHGNALPAPIALDSNVPSPDPDALSCGASNFECFEGMYVSVINGLVTRANQNFGSDPYAEVFISTTGTRSLREPGLLFGLTPTVGDNDAAGVWDGNPEIFEMDLDALLGFYNGIALNAGSRFIASGVIGYGFGDYQFWPADIYFDYLAPIPRPVPSADPAVLRIGDFNVQRLCDDIDDVTGGTATYECGDNGLPSTAEYQLKLARVSDYIGGVLNLPDVVALQEVEKLEVLNALAARIASDYGTAYSAYLLEGNDPGGIDVAYLVDASRIDAVSVTQLDAGLLWTDPEDGMQKPVHDRPPLLLEGVFQGDGGLNQPFMLIANHLKARSNVDDGDSDAARDSEKRLRQAVSIATHVQALQSDPLNSGVPMIVLGDMNAYQFTDGFVDIVGMISGEYDFAANLYDRSDFSGLGTDVNIVSPPLWNAVLSLPQNERYSYLYTQNFGDIQGFDPRRLPTNQVLDHALLNSAAHGMFLRMDYGRANLDVADEDEESSTGVIGVSDHDGFVLQLGSDRIFADGFEGIN